jgi:TerC family integral membrane protein
VSAELLWTGFVVLLAGCIAVDLWAHRRPRRISLGEAAGWTGAWVAVGLSFTVLAWLLLGPDLGLQFLAGYLVEWSLSIDNVFVFVLILAGLSVPDRYTHRVLLVGALGAIVLRLLFMLAGSALLDRFEWVVYPFGALLVIAAARFLRQSEGDAILRGRLARLASRVLRVCGEYEQGRLLRRVHGRLYATPLVLALALVTGADLVFAIDSVPAVFAMTRDRFIAFSSNALAVLGLRSAYFLLEGALDRLRYLRPALALLLALVGLKMLSSTLVEVPVVASLAVIVAVLGAGVSASWLADRPLAPVEEVRTR